MIAQGGAKRSPGRTVCTTINEALKGRATVLPEVARPFGAYCLLWGFVPLRFALGYHSAPLRG
jgi:hypothetical protein